MAVIAAVNKHQGLLRATVASAGQDHRLGANEAPPAIISVFLGTELEDVFTALAEGRAGVSATGSLMAFGTPVLPSLAKETGDRNRTSPFAFTGNKFEFRALGSNQSTGLPNTVLNTIVAEGIDDLLDKLEEARAGGDDLATALPAVLGEAFRTHRPVVFGGDGYSQEWHDEAAERGLLNLPTTPDALPQLIAESTVQTLGGYRVLDERELQARYEIALEQYVITVNIEAETAADIAATMILPAAARYLGELDDADLDEFADELRQEVKGFIAAIRRFQEINAVHPDEGILVEAVYMRDQVIPP